MSLTSNPVVSEPVGKHTWVVEAEDIDVRAMNEVVRHNGDVTCITQQKFTFTIKFAFPVYQKITQQLIKVATEMQQNDFMHKYLHLLEPGSDDADIDRAGAQQLLDELLRPARRLHDRVVIDAVVVGHVVHVRGHHSVILRPRRMT